jgi:hypothetical protein
MDTFSTFSTINLSEITFIGGSYRELAFDVFNTSGSPINLHTMQSCKWILSPFGKPETATLLKDGVIDPIINNRFWVYLLSSDTASLSGKYVQQPIVVASTDYEFRLGQGYLNIIPAGSFTTVTDGQSFNQQIVFISNSVTTFEADVSGSITNFESQVSGSITNFESEVSGSITNFESQVSGSLSSFSVASGSTLAAGTNNTQYASAKGLKDAGFVPIHLTNGVPHKQLWVAGWKPTLTNGCAYPAQIEMGTNKNVYDYLAFDSINGEYAYANVTMPDDYSGGGVYFKAYWTHPATTTNFGVVWGFSAAAVANDATLDSALVDVSAIVDTGGTTNFLYIGSLSPALTINGSPAAGNLCHFKIGRYPTNVNDTLAVDAYLLGVMIWYPVA